VSKVDIFPRHKLKKPPHKLNSTSAFQHIFKLNRAAALHIRGGGV